MICNNCNKMYLRKNNKRSNAMPMTRLGLGGRKILAGYWFEWLNETAPTYVFPGDIPLEYNMIIVAFMYNRADGIPTFSPDPNFLSDQEFIDGVNLWKSQGREVVISLGGAAGHYELRMNQKEAFKEELRRIFNKYGFTGIDIDLENTSIDAGDNEKVIPEVLNELKSEFNFQGRQFLITMAPEFPYMRTMGFGGKSYGAYLNKLNYDLVLPQYYNQGGDGVFATPSTMIGNNNVAKREDFIYYMTKALITGKDAGYSWFKVPADKICVGLPSAPGAAYGNGVYYTDPEVINRALNRLANDGMETRGVMTWSINQDQPSGFDFGRRMGSLLGISGEVSPPGPTGPTGPTIPPEPPVPTGPTGPTVGSLEAPRNVRLVSQTDKCVAIAWDAPFNMTGITGYNVYRNNSLIGSVQSTQNIFVDRSSLERAFYKVTSVGENGVESDFSNEIEVTRPGTVTPPPPPPPPPPPEEETWNQYKYYVVNNVVKHNGLRYAANFDNQAQEPGIWRQI